VIRVIQPVSRPCGVQRQRWADGHIDPGGGVKAVRCGRPGGGAVGPRAVVQGKETRVKRRAGMRILEPLLDGHRALHGPGSIAVAVAACRRVVEIQNRADERVSGIVGRGMPAEDQFNGAGEDRSVAAADEVARRPGGQLGVRAGGLHRQGEAAVFVSEGEL